MEPARSHQSFRGLHIGFEMISAGSGFAPGAGGMISYYDGLLRGLCALDRVAQITVFVAPWNGDLAVPEHDKIRLVACRGLPRARAGRIVYEQTVLPLLARRSSVDVLLCTVNVMPLLRRAPTVVVLQSIQYIIWPTQVGRIRGAYLRAVTPRSLKRATRVIAVTDTERADALRLFQLEPDRVVTVYHGVSRWTKTALEGLHQTQPYKLPTGAPYVLIVSRLYEHKNHRRLVEAFAAVVQAHGLPHHLVVAGGDADVRAETLAEQAGRLGVSNRIHLLGVVPQDDIPGLFAGADAIAYPSLYETFGHPVLEALAFAQPLVTSSAGATGEIAGHAARLVNPESIESISEGLRDVLLDEDLRRRLAQAGPGRAAEFTWERCAEQTLAVLLAATGEP